MPHMKNVPSHWRSFQAVYNLVGQKCENCGSYYFPPRPICPKCRRDSKLVPYKFSGKGEVVTFSIVRAPPEGYELVAPYAVAIIKLDEGPMLTAQLTDVELEDIKIGMRVEMAFRRLYEADKEAFIRYGYKFRPEWKPK